ncbi:MAG: 4Fe-4S dicluster domain-containing protein [Bradymonadales bacterium]|nr:4Fe-4S dicluster domain-containing protein [Bradymonadales bacterium]
MRLVLQPEKCTGCRLCEQICSIHHFHETNTKKAAIRISGMFPDPGHYRQQVCNQCWTCIEVCPTGAIVNQEGAIQVIAEECIACWECVESCPEGAIFVHEEIDYPIICDLCFECVEVCNTGALTRGE